jgi:protease II
MPAGIFIFNY